MNKKLFRLLICAAALTTAIVSAAEDAPAPTASEKATMDAVWTALNAQPALIDHHRGFVTYISSHPELASALNAISPLQRHPMFRGLLVEFDNSLARYEELDRIFGSYYAALAAEEPLRDAVDAVYRLELSEPSLRDSFIDLLGDVDESLRFLANPAKPAPIPLYPFKAAFNQSPDLREELLIALNTLHKIPAAHTDIFPWWEKVSKEQDSFCRPFVNLASQLMEHPQRFWAWHGAQIVLAKDLKARAWIFYVQRQVRQHPTLSKTYDIYLDIVRRRPDYAKAALDKWESDLGPAPPWPPDSDPPKLPVPPEDKADATRKRPTRPDVKKPVAQMPQMPDMPVRPVKPEKPEIRRPKPAVPTQKTK